MSYYRVEQVDRFDPSDAEWAIVEPDGAIVDRFDTETEAREALPSYNGETKSNE